MIQITKKIGVKATVAGTVTVTGTAPVLISIPWSLFT
jgi:hypothetical protein